jgi:hypothetical protein
MALCDPDAEIRCGTLDCSEPDYRLLQPEEVPWDALEQSVFGGAGAHTRVRSVKDIQVGRRRMGIGHVSPDSAALRCGVRVPASRLERVDPR